ncbi:DUF2384 domain-containing protein [Rhizobium sp. NIBRBAC000502774]|nr:DUF2384 domain-containing protein [Rhizobium sp. NIBRBAC000502774]
MIELQEETHFTTFGFDDDDRVRLYGKKYRVKARPDGLGYIFSPTAGGNVYQPLHLEISRLISERELKVDRNWFAEENAFKRAEAADHGDLPSYAVNRYLMVTKFLEGYHAGTWKKTVESAAEFYEFWDGMREAKRGGTRRDDWDPLVRVKPRQFLRQVEAFLAASRNPYSLVLKHSGKTKHKSKFTDDVREIAYEYIVRIPDAKRPEASDLYDEFLDDPMISLIKDKHQIPCRRTFERWAAKRLQDLHLAVAHKGHDAAKDAFQMAGAGPRRYKPLERIEIDETKLDVMNLLKGTHLEGLINEQTKKKIRAMRFWASIAIDVGTKSILALRLLDSDPGGRSGIETLAMAVSPKDGVALFAGSESPWPMHGLPQTVSTDSGAAFDQKDFQYAVVSLCDVHLIPPVRNARNRGTIERYFRTQNQRYMHLFSGRTFGNPIVRGDYDAEANAGLNFKEFARLLVRLIVDCYHRTPHEGLNNQTPLDAWTTETRKYQVRNLLEKHERIFDITVHGVRIGRNGVKFLGIPYFDKRLQKIRNHYKNGLVNIRINPWNLGSIGLETVDGTGYVPLRTPIPGFDGLSVTHWRSVKRWMDQRFSINQQADLEIRRRGLRETKGEIAVAEDRNDVSSHQVTEEDLLEWNRTEFKNDIFQPKADQDWGDFVPDERDAEVPGPIPADAPRSKRNILSPSSSTPLDPDRFAKARSEAGLREQPSAPARTPRSRKKSSDGSEDVPARKSRQGQRKRLFNPDWKTDEK